MTRYGYDDDDGQDDGDSVGGAVEFQSSLGSVDHPWMREGMAPWHLWGNTLEIRTVVQEAALGVPIQPSTGQLVKISYKRPESWQWILSTRLISGPPGSIAAPDGSVSLTVLYDLITGIGRSTIIMQKEVGVISAVGSRSKSFEQHNFFWDAGSGGFPAGAKIWTTQVLAPPRTFQTFAPAQNTSGNAVAPGESASVIDRIVAQDIQLSCRVSVTAQTGDTAIGQPVVLEVSAQFAPMAHVRPDWYQSARTPTEARFPGAETGGK